MPLWREILGLLFTIIFIVFTTDVFYGFIKPFTFDGKSNSFGMALATLFISLLLLLKVPFCVKFDVHKKSFKREYGFRFFRLGKWRAIKKIDYISVFAQGYGIDADQDGVSNGTACRFDVNIWYDTNRYITVYSGINKESAFIMAKFIAIHFQVDLLDATVSGNKKWIVLTDL